MYMNKIYNKFIRQKKKIKIATKKMKNQLNRLNRTIHSGHNIQMYYQLKIMIMKVTVQNYQKKLFYLKKEKTDNNKENRHSKILF